MKTKQCLLINYLILVLCSSCSNEITILNSQFTEQKNASWDVPSTEESGYSKINNGKLIIHNTSTENLFYKQTCNDNFNGALSFKWETLIVQSFKNDPNAHGGLVWSDYDSEYLNYFGYNSNKEVVIIKESNQGDTYLFKETIENLSPLEVNKLSVIREKTDGDLSFWINDKEVHRLSFKEIFVGLHNSAKYTCFGFWTSSHLEADYLTVLHTPF